MPEYILYIGEMELPDKNAAAQRVIANCKIIKEVTPYEVVMIGLNSNENITNDILKNNYNLNGIHVYEYPYPNNALQWFRYITQINYIEDIVEHLGVKQVKAIIAYNYPALALDRLRNFCSDKGIEIISDVSEWYGKSHRRFPSNLVKDLDTLLRMRFVNKRIDKLICISNYLEDYYESNKNSILNVPSLVDESSVKVESYKDFSDKNLKIYSYVGSPGKTKEKDRIDWIINSFYKLMLEGYKFKLILVGMDKDSLLEIYPELTLNINEMENYVVFKGRVKRTDALGIIAGSDFSVFARNVNRVTTAGFPTKLAESFACQTPVITTPSSNISDYITNNKTGFISKDCTEDSFFKAIKKSIVLNQQQINNMSLNLKTCNPLSLRNYYNSFNEFFKGLNR